MISVAMKSRVVVALTTIVVVLFVPHVPAAPRQDAIGSTARRTGWTLDEALTHLRLHPRDVYVQYVALQLARREGRLTEVLAQIERGRRGRDRFSARSEQIDLFSIFSGALAVQESLQLDAMRDGIPSGATPDEMQRFGGPRFGPPEIGQSRFRNRTATVPVSDLVGPTIKSHPWDKMLMGKVPDVSLLSRSVPDDFYFVEFRSVQKLIEMSELADLWSTHLFNQAVQDSQTQLVNRRLREQLAVEISPSLRPFYDSAVQEVAVAGSDLLMTEGSDVTLLFHARQPAVLRAKMDEFLTRAEQSRPDAVRTSDNYMGVDVVHVTTPDRQIHVFSAYPAANLHVRSNSRVALERVLEAVRGETADGQAVQRLGKTAEFAYIRTLMPRGAGEEDGFIYLSDPFVRRLVGPAFRLTEHRRLLCYNHLKMISHAALMYRTEHGANAASLEELAAAECSPGEFGKGQLVCSEGGVYSLAADGLTGVCSHHGYASYLTPCCEIETRKVTAAEAEAYRRFVTEYNSYWRTYFDPIAIRLQITPERYRAETIVLPLIDNSVYMGLASAIGGPTEPLDALPVPKRNIFSVAARFNKEALLRQAGMEGLLDRDESSEQLLVTADTPRAVDSLRQLALAMHNHHDAKKRFPAAASMDKDGRPLLSWRVHILPFLGQQNVYQQFHLDEPWDSEHNRQLISRMPAVFQPGDQQLAAAGWTRFVAPRGESTVFPPDGQPIRFSRIVDGSSQTILLVEADDEHAVVWTKPDDLEIDPDEPHRGLAVRSPGAYLVAFADGSMHMIGSDIDRATFAVLFTRAGQEFTDWRRFDRSQALMAPRRALFDVIPIEMAQKLKLGELLTKGIGNQVGFHVYDSEPMFDLNMSRFLGMAVSSFRGGGFDDEILGVALLVGSLNSPVYVSIPIQDEKIVDEFLARLDGFLAELARRPSNGFFFSLGQDFYQLQLGGESSVHSYSLRVGPVKWRFFWARIGDAVYAASKPDILTDLQAIHSQDEDAAGEAGPAAHALIRIRPQNWNRVLAHYRLGWEENNREACLNNLGPLTSLCRALVAGRSAGPLTETEVREMTGRLCDVNFFCPDGGNYVVALDGMSVSCTAHGSAQSPRQPASPNENSELGQLMQGLSDMSVALSFLEDGLHAVVTVERTPNSRQATTTSKATGAHRSIPQQSWDTSAVPGAKAQELSYSNQSRRERDP
jgi:hypothetical protein